MNKFKWHFACVSLIVTPFLLTACGSGGSSEPETDNTETNTEPDTRETLEVTSTSPSNTESEVSRNSLTIQAEFNKDVFAKSVDATSFTLEQGSETIPASVSFDATSNTASLSPDNPLAMLTEYTVTANAGITDLDGTPLETPYQWSFTTADGSWQTGEKISRDLPGFNFTWELDISMDDSGNAIALWTHQGEGARDLWANRFDGNSWGAPELLEGSEDKDFYITYPRVATGPNGSAIAAWVQLDGVEATSMRNVHAKVFENGEWGSTTVFQVGASTEAHDLKIAIDDKGNAFVIWEQYNTGDGFNIYATRYDGSIWSSPERLESNIEDWASDPDIALDGNGNAIAIWSQRTDGVGVTSIYAKRFDGNSWGNEELIETNDAGDTSVAQIAFDANGNAIATWLQDDGIRDNLWANRFNGSTWGNAELIETIDSGDLLQPRLAVTGDGKAMVVWEQRYGYDTGADVWANYFDGTNWGTAETLDADGGTVAYPQIAFDGHGKAIAIWVQNGSPWFNRFHDNSWDTAKEFNADSALPPIKTELAMDSSGNAIAVFNRGIGQAGQMVSAARFE